ncbi:hypothetical protein IGI37_003840 [Enterococcus sp. AZ194]|uniref:hypothetical protein n=1 Tax=Enterococcus sp. AZ194 TaxID=2774629 RepID=UPI003F22998F
MSQSRITTKQLFQENLRDLEKKIFRHYMKDGLVDVALQQHRCLQIRCAYREEPFRELLGETLIRGIYLNGYRPNDHYWLAKMYPYFRHYFTEEEHKKIIHRFDIKISYQLRLKGEFMVDMEALIESEAIRAATFTFLMDPD